MITKRKGLILAGGLGTRMSEVTKTIPKPMVKVLNKPILIHIMEHYYKFGFREFYIALGYKGNVIRNFTCSVPKFFIDWINFFFCGMGICSITSRNKIKS